MVTLMRFGPFVKAFLFAAMTFSVARVLLVHDGVGVVEWLVGVVVVAALGAGAAHFVRLTLRTT